MTTSDEMKSNPQNRTDAVGRPLLTSYDSGHEHSLDHWIELQHLVSDAEGGFPPLSVREEPDEEEDEEKDGEEKEDEEDDEGYSE
jgi:hypothetical protein